MPIPNEFLGRMRGRGVIVTGAGTQGSSEGVGTGKAIAFLMAAEGARVALVDRDTERVDVTQKMIADHGGESKAFLGDVTDAHSVAHFVGEAVAWLGGLDALINNVGAGAGSSRIEDMTPEMFKHNIDINLTSAFLVTRAAIPSLLAGAGKAVVNIASLAGLRAHGAAGYGAAKAGLIEFTHELAVIYGRDGLRANAIAPGHIYTPLVAGFEAMRDVRRRIGPLGIEGDAWDVAQATLFLSGPESRFITGACLPVDGGVSAIAPWAAWQLLQRD
ncbi:MAG: SDR family oxidoreductase [Pseudoxanthomonas sp.]